MSLKVTEKEGPEREEENQRNHHPDICSSAGKVGYLTVTPLKASSSWSEGVSGKEDSSSGKLTLVSNISDRLYEMKIENYPLGLVIRKPVATRWRGFNQWKKEKEAR